ncbi:MAG: RNA polymerase sigma-70 factor [Bacteroidales bacterium]|nr:MAG: RNA polymerase sigma-70 factor [Bacteroidales bacterium]
MSIDEKFYFLSGYSNKAEKILVREIKGGDHDSFRQIYYKYSEKVYLFTVRYISNVGDAEEIVQEVFSRIWEYRNNLDENRSFNGYILTITKNIIFNENRKKVNFNIYCKYIINYLQGISNQTENQVIYESVKNLINKEINNFPPKRRQIFNMSRNEGLSYNEIAKKLSISEKTVESHLRLALNRLRKVISSILNNNL